MLRLWQLTAWLLNMNKPKIVAYLKPTCGWSQGVRAVLLWPFVPSTATRINAQLGLTTSPDKLNQASWGGLKQGHTIAEVAPLFPRKDAKPG